MNSARGGLGARPEDRSGLRALTAAIHGGLRAGEIGGIRAAGGVGKSSLLVHLGLDALQRGDVVLHLAAAERSLTPSPGVGPVLAAVRELYDTILGGQHPGWRTADRAAFLVAVERSRFIAPLSEPVTAAQVLAVLTRFRALLDVTPSLVLVDGWDASADTLGELRETLRTFGSCLWAAGASTAGSQGDLLDVALELRPDGGQVQAYVLHDRGQPLGGPVPLERNLARTDRPLTDEPRPGASGCVLYSGGAAGTEAAFGQAAERFGVNEVNYTFDGHVQVRSRGAHPLTEAELEAGDVSLSFVAHRLKRDYGEGNMLRRVLQSLWHQVGEAQEVFVIGTIQPDGTVTGGTGWAAELARMWHRRLWVFDQEKGSWYTWIEPTGAPEGPSGWVPGVAEISAARFCGTGTRYLQKSGAEAIAALFERAFGR